MRQVDRLCFRLALEDDNFLSFPTASSRSLGVAFYRPPSLPTHPGHSPRIAFLSRPLPAAGRLPVLCPHLPPQVFGRCLLSCPSIELWGAYLRFVRHSNERRGAAGLAEVKGAYEFTLDVLGQV